MGIIAINNLYIAKMPNSCKECPLTYLDTDDDDYYGAYERRCVIDDSCIDGMTSERAYDCPLVEAIPKTDYEARLRADMVAMLTEIQLEFEELEPEYDCNSYSCGIADCYRTIQEKITSLKEART